MCEYYETMRQSDVPVNIECRAAVNCYTVVPVNRSIEQPLGVAIGAYCLVATSKDYRRQKDKDEQKGYHHDDENSISYRLINVQVP